MHGFYGRILKIDLSAQKFDIEALSDKIYLQYPGGKGLASYLLYVLNPKGVDPLSPDNRLIFATGPVTGSLIWGSSRYGVFTKSPQTGCYAESYSGGKVPEAIDSAGFDAVVVTGKAGRPTVIVVHPGGAEFYDATEIWGLATFETEDIVNKRYGAAARKADKSGAVVIGPAAENLVRFAVISNDYWRCAGRTGIGTVMGSKLVKAIVFKGDKKRPLFDNRQAVNFAKQFAADAKDHPVAVGYKATGTPGMVQTINQAKAFPTRYWSEGFFDKWENISARALHEQCRVKPRACSKCFIACGRLTTVVKGRHAGLKIEGPEYETIFAFGGLCLVDSIEEIAYLNDICDRLGMDTISAGNLCGFAIEAALKKKIDYPISYGDVDAIADLLVKIAARQDIGAILSEGIVRAAKAWNMQDTAVHVKGLEPPGYDPRVLKGCGLAFATSGRGACHLRATFHAPELRGISKPENIKGKAAMLIDYEDRLTLMDTLILCRFYRDLYSWESLQKIFAVSTGINADQSTLRKKAAAISNLVRWFNFQEGLQPEDDTLPRRLHKEALKTGHKIEESELKSMRQEYYSLRGWDKDGLPKHKPDL